MAITRLIMNYLVEIGDGSQVLSVFLWRCKTRVELQTSDHVEDGVLGEHQLEKRVFVQEKHVLEDIVEVVKTLPIFQVFAHVEHIQ